LVAKQLHLFAVSSHQLSAGEYTAIEHRISTAVVTQKAAGINEPGGREKRRRSTTHQEDTSYRWHGRAKGAITITQANITSSQTSSQRAATINTSTSPVNSYDDGSAPSIRITSHCR
ncbi:hypothetical protein diail_9177, partial [Diaporthe ilicicola]